MKWKIVFVIYLELEQNDKLKCIEFFTNILVILTVYWSFYSFQRIPSVLIFFSNPQMVHFFFLIILKLSDI